MYEFAVYIAKSCKDTKKKLRYAKKIIKFPNFQELYCPLDFLSAKAILWEMSISVCCAFLRPNLPAAEQ